MGAKVSRGHFFIHIDGVVSFSRQPYCRANLGGSNRCSYSDRLPRFFPRSCSAHRRSRRDITTLDDVEPLVLSNACTATFPKEKKASPFPLGIMSVNRVFDQELFCMDNGAGLPCIFDLETELATIVARWFFLGNGTAARSFGWLVLLEYGASVPRVSSIRIGHCFGPVCENTG